MHPLKTITTLLITFLLCSCTHWLSKSKTYEYRTLRNAAKHEIDFKLINIHVDFLIFAGNATMNCHAMYVGDSKLWISTKPINNKKMLKQDLSNFIAGHCILINKKREYFNVPDKWQISSYKIKHHNLLSKEKYDSLAPSDTIHESVYLVKDRFYKTSEIEI